MKKALRTILNFILTIITSCLSIFVLMLPVEVLSHDVFSTYYILISSVIVLIVCYILRVRYDIKYRYYACSSVCALAITAFPWKYEYTPWGPLSYSCVLFIFFFIGLLIDTIAIHIRKAKKAKNVSDSK